jgi:hypothetical protein
MKDGVHNALWNAQQRWFALRDQGETILSPSSLCLLPLLLVFSS